MRPWSAEGKRNRGKSTTEVAVSRGTGRSPSVGNRPDHPIGRPTVRHRRPPQRRESPGSTVTRGDPPTGGRSNLDTTFPGLPPHQPHLSQTRAGLRVGTAPTTRSKPTRPDSIRERRRSKTVASQATPDSPEQTGPAPPGQLANKGSLPPVQPPWLPSESRRVRHGGPHRVQHGGPHRVPALSPTPSGA